MYCPECREKIEGNYCSECGTKGVEKNQIDQLVIKSWREEKDLSVLVEHTEVQTIIRNVVATSKKSISADEFLKRVDVLFSPISGLSLKKTADIVIPISKRLGIKTGKSKTVSYQGRIQEITVKIICSLAKNNYPLAKVEHANDGIIIVAEIPSDMKTFGGEILIALQEDGEAIEVNIDAKVKGQLYDWGKSKGAVKKIHRDIEELQLDVE